MLLSLFCGAGGLDLGFEQAGFEVGLALDRKQDSVNSYNHNRPGASNAKVQDLSAVTLNILDDHYRGEFRPTGVIGGPPCQSFSQANVNQRVNDARSSLPRAYANIVSALHKRSPLDFFVMENVAGLTLAKHEPTLIAVELKLRDSGFRIARLMLNAKDYGTPQNRPRLFLIGINEEKFPHVNPGQIDIAKEPGGDVRGKIGKLSEPWHFRRGIDMSAHPEHVNHWCMAPRSPKFHQEGGVKPGIKGRSFKMLDWEAPSIAVAYGHREVNIHPNGKRRLSVYEAMLLQGFPPKYELLGNLSSQIDQVSEAVPPPLARAVASALKRELYAEGTAGASKPEPQAVGAYAVRAAETESVVLNFASSPVAQAS